MKKLFYLPLLIGVLGQNLFAITEGYAGAQSVAQGGSITLHVSTAASSYYLQIFREGATRQLVHTIPRDSLPAGANRFQSGQNYVENGCNWPVSYTLRIPASWKSGAYIVKICASADSGTVRMNYPTRYYQNNIFINEIFFVVKPVNPGQASKILFVIGDNTYQAYNGWGGGSYYYSQNQTMTVSFRRPYGDFDGYNQCFHDWDKKFIRWMEGEEGYVVDYISESDLDADPTAAWVGNYRVMVWDGHGFEYQSPNEWDCATTFQEQFGGKLLVFSGNSCWWHVTFNSGRSQMNKGANFSSAEQFDLIGLNFVGNNKHWMREDNYPPYYANLGTGEKCGYTVSQQGAAHWIFTGTGLNPGAVFGYQSKVLGYEYDGRSYTYSASTHSMTTTGAPAGLTILGANRYNAGSSGYDEYDYTTTNTSIVIFPRGSTGGFTFNSGNINWAYGLYVPDEERTAYTHYNGNGVDTFTTDPYVQRVTKNLIDSLALGVLDRTLIGVEAAGVRSALSMAVWPNPARGRVSLQAGLGASVQIYDARGRRVAIFNGGNEGKLVWDTSLLAAGIYTLRVVNGKNSLIRRVAVVK